MIPSHCPFECLPLPQSPPPPLHPLPFSPALQSMLSYQAPLLAVPLDLSMRLCRDPQRSSRLRCAGSRHDAAPPFSSSHVSQLIVSRWHLAGTSHRRSKRSKGTQNPDAVVSVATGRGRGKKGGGDNVSSSLRRNGPTGRSLLTRPYPLHLRRRRHPHPGPAQWPESPLRPHAARSVSRLARPKRPELGRR